MHLDQRRRVIVGVNGSPGNLEALRHAAAEARRRDAALWAVTAWRPQGGEVAERRAPCPELTRVQQDTAATRLRRAWDEALGGIPVDLEVELHTVRGPAGERLVQMADRPDDLIVVGAGSGGPLTRLLNGSVARYCLRHARCGVLTVPPPALQRSLAHHPLARRRMLRELTAQH
jgi:nucleotide-binding universal stress UspA family protein